MTDLPEARVRDRRAQITSYAKKLAIVVAVIGVAWWFWSQRPGNEELAAARRLHTAEGYAKYAAGDADRRDDVRGDLAKLHQAARDQVAAGGAPDPDGLDPLLQPLLARVDHVVAFATHDLAVDAASFTAVEDALRAPHSEVAPLVPHLQRGVTCDDGFTEAFREATGTDVVEFRADELGTPALRVTWTVRASGTGYVEAHSRRIYPGIHVEGMLELVDGSRSIVATPFSVTPASDVAFTTYGVQFGAGSHDPEVAHALVTAACKQAGFALLAKLTGYAPRTAPGKRDDDEACKRGNSAACLAAARAKRTTDPREARMLLEQGCRQRSIESGPCCVEAAELALAHPTKDKINPLSDPMLAARSEARLSLDHGCNDHYAEACARLGRLLVAPRTGSDKPTPGDLHDGVRALVRACDLGVRAACREAAALIASPGIAGVPLPSVAAVLEKRGCEPAAPCKPTAAWAKARDATIFEHAIGKDRVFDVRWGDWFHMDDGQIVVWLASADDRDAVYTRATGRRARVYAPDELPYGLVAPPGTKTVWGLIPSEPLFKDDRECQRCTTGALPDPMLAVASMGCVCLPLDAVR